MLALLSGQIVNLSKNLCAFQKCERQSNGKTFGSLFSQQSINHHYRFEMHQLHSSCNQGQTSEPYFKQEKIFANGFKT